MSTFFLVVKGHLATYVIARRNDLCDVGWKWWSFCTLKHNNQLLHFIFRLKDFHLQWNLTLIMIHPHYYRRIPMQNDYAFNDRRLTRVCRVDFHKDYSWNYSRSTATIKGIISYVQRYRIRWFGKKQHFYCTENDTKNIQYRFKFIFSFSFRLPSVYSSTSYASNACWALNLRGNMKGGKEIRSWKSQICDNDNKCYAVAQCHVD